MTTPIRLDFHLHTTASDGGLRPVDLLAAVRASRLDAWAVTDHDTLAGWRLLGKEPGLIPGVEVTAERAGREIHVVGLGIDPEQREFADFLAHIRALRRSRLSALIISVREQDRLRLIDLSPEADCLTRSHLAQALVTLGRARNLGRAFDELIGDAHCAALGLPPYPSVPDACAAIRAAGGVAILAHPGIYGTLDAVRPLLDEGVDGLETAHPRLGADLEREFRDEAAKRGLLESIGSDTHRLGVRVPGDPQPRDGRSEALIRRLGITRH